MYGKMRLGRSSRITPDILCSAEATSVKLKSKQEEIFEVEKEVACRSVTVKNMVEDTGLDTPVPLPMVDSKILIKARDAWLGVCAHGLHDACHSSLCCADFLCYPSACILNLSAFLQVIEYCKYHHRAESNLTSEDDKNTWDKDFVKVDDETLFNLILAANYLDIKSLLDLTCKTVADEIKGKTPEEIRTRFNIKNDFTPEEEEEVKRENAWCEER
eukprot:scaffold98086_cov31-Tisochrysis_lutea.AAC.1